MRYCFALDLVADAELIAAYERWHAPGGVWPEVLADIRAQGVEAMEIWRVDDRLMMIVEAGPDFLEPRPEPPKVAEWQTLMWRFQRALPGRPPGEKWAPMACVFRLADQPQ